MKYAGQLAAVVMIFVLSLVSHVAGAASPQAKKAGAAQKPSNEIFLSGAEFKRLSPKYQAQYIGDLRQFFIELEKTKPYKVSDAKTFQVPSWLWEVAVAQTTDKWRFVAGYAFPKVAGQPGSIPGNLKCDNGGKPGVYCNPVAFWFKTGESEAGRYCVDEFDSPVPPATTSTLREYITFRCEQESRKNANRDTLIAAWIAKEPARLAELDRVQNAAKAEACSNVGQVNDGLCNRMRTRTSSVRAKLPAAAPVAAASTGSGEAGEEGTALPRGEPELPEGTETDEQRRAREEQARRNAEASARCKSSAYLEANNPIFCQFKLKNEDRYFSLRYSGDTKTQLELWEADETDQKADGIWCKKSNRSGTERDSFGWVSAGFAPGKDKDIDLKTTDANGKTTTKKITCQLDQVKITTNAFTKDGKTMSFKVNRQAHGTNECDFDGVNGAKEPEKEDFIMGVDTESTEFSKTTSGKENATGKKEPIIAKILEEADKSGKDAFEYDYDKVGCPDEATRNLAYALAAVQGVKGCYVQEPQVVTQSGRGDSDEDGIRVKIMAPLAPAGAHARGTLGNKVLFRSYKDKFGNYMQSVDLVRTRQNMSVANWLRGDKNDDTGAEFGGILGAVKSADKHSCRDTAPEGTSPGSTANQ